MSTVHLPGCDIDLERGVAVGAGWERRLTTKEVQLLDYLWRNPGRTIPQEELLTEVWGYSRNSRSGTVYTTITRLRNKVEERPREPQSILTVFGEGYRFEPAERTEPVRTNLERRPDRFFGRDAELDELAGRFAAGECLVTLTGAGGTGKTRLAVEFGLAKVAAFPGGVWWCDLTEATSAMGVCHAVARALGTTSKGVDPVDHVARAIAERGPVLLVLDNLEQVVGVAPDTIGVWLARCPEARWLVTSRVPLAVPGERRMRLAPLPLPYRDGADASDNPGVLLFCERATAADHRFRLDAANRGDVVELVRDLDGLPLAIELAAPWMAVITPRDLLQRLDERFRLLRRERTSGPARHSTLRRTIDWSWAQLDPAEQRVLAQCSVFEGGFDPEAAEAVVDLSDLDDPPLVLRVLQRLTTRSLLRRVGGSGSSRLGMLVSIQAYAAEKLADMDDGSAELRHARHYGSIVRRRPKGVQPLVFRQRMAADIDNLVVAMRRSLARGDTAIAIGAFDGVQMAAGYRGPALLERRMADELLASGGLTPLQAAVVHRSRGTCSWFLGYLEAGRRDLESSVERAREAGNDLQAVFSQFVLSGIVATQGDWVAGVRLAEGVLEEGGRFPRYPIVVNAMTNIAWSWANMDLLDDARRLAAEALVLAGQQGFDRCAMYAEGALAVIDGWRGAAAAAREGLTNAIVDARRFEDHRYEGYALQMLAEVHLDAGELDAADECLDLSGAALRRGDFAFNDAKRLYTVGRLQVLRGDRDAARETLHQLRRFPAAREVRPRSMFARGITALELALAASEQGAG